MIGTHAAAAGFAAAADGPWNDYPKAPPPAPAAAAPAGPWDDYKPKPAAPAQPGVIVGPPKQPSITENRNYELSLRSANRADDAAGRAVANDARRIQIDAERAAREGLRDERTAVNDARTTANVAFDNTSNLRKEFTGRQEVKDFQTILPMVASAERIAMNPHSTGADDLNLIYTFGKVMDPGSVVREGELALASQTGSFAQTLEGAVSRLQNGERLPAQVRHNLVESMRRRGIEMARAYNQTRGGYKDMAGRYDINPLDIVGEHPAAPYQQTEADFANIPINNLDGSMGARPHRAPTQMQGDVDIGFSGREKADFNPQQEQAFAAFFQHNPQASPEQINAFAQSIGLAGVANGQELADYYAKGGRGFGGLQQDRRAEHAAAQKLAAVDGQGDFQKVITQGATFGLSDEVAGATTAVSQLLGGDLDMGKNYRIGREAEDINVREAREHLGWAGTAAEIGGGLLSMNPESIAAAVANPSLMGRVAAGARTGAAGGGIAGFGYGRDMEGSIGGAAMGAAGGAALGGALPIAGSMIGSRVAGARRMMGRERGLPDQIVGEAIEADGGDAATIAQRLRDAQERGSPLAIGDTGDNARGLLASMGRQPGTSRTTTRDAVIGRQMEQGDRIDAAATRDLGPSPNVRDLGDELIGKARERAAPLYEKAYAAPNATSAGVEMLLSRPSMRSALGRAFRIAEEEGRDPRTLGLMMDDAGNVALNGAPLDQMSAVEAARRELDAAQHAYKRARSIAGTKGEADVSGMRGRVEAAREKLRTASANLKAAPVEGDPKQVSQYTWQTLDYVKRGIDDVLEARRDPTTNKLVLDEEGRAINNTLRTFLRRVDKANPTYGEARAVYAGPARMKEALDKGSKALNQPAEELEAIVAGLQGEPEREMFRQGYRKAISEHIESRTDGGDKVQALLGTMKKRRALHQVFGGKPEFDRFIATLGDEGAMNETYRAVNTGSQTAERSAQDALTDDNGLMESAVGTMIRGVRSPLKTTAEVLERMRGADRFGAGQAGRDTRQSVADMLTQSDPDTLEGIFERIAASRTAQEAGEQAAARRAGPAGLQAGKIVGAGIGSKSKERKR